MTHAVGRPQITSRYAGQTVLGIGAHPDDLELGVGGTLARLSRAGARVVMAVVSIPNELELRTREARRGAEILGGEIRLLTPDRCSRVEDLKNHELVAMIDRLVEELKPGAVFTHCLPNFHVDHKLVYEACLACQRRAYFDLYCYSPTACSAVNIPFHPHAYVDITDTVEAKMAAIQAHASQFERRGIPTDGYRDTVGRYGQLAGVPYAEGLEIVRLRFN